MPVLPKTAVNVISRQTILAFIISAWMSGLIAAIAYIFNLVPEELLGNYDRVFLRRTAAGSLRWRKIITRAIVTLSDQQIVTGLAVLIAAYSQLDSISIYHWFIATYLAWISSAVHLTSLTYLRSWLERYPAVRVSSFHSVYGQHGRGRNVLEPAAEAKLLTGLEIGWHDDALLPPLRRALSHWAIGF